MNKTGSRAGIADVREIDIKIGCYCQVGFFNPTFCILRSQRFVALIQEAGTVDIFNIILFHLLFVLSLLLLLILSSK